MLIIHNHVSALLANFCTRTEHRSAKGQRFGILSKYKGQNSNTSAMRVCTCFSGMSGTTGVLACKTWSGCGFLLMTSVIPPEVTVLLEVLALLEVLVLLDELEVLVLLDELDDGFGPLEDGSGVGSDCLLACVCVCGSNQITMLTIR